MSHTNPSPSNCDYARKQQEAEDHTKACDQFAEYLTENKTIKDIEVMLDRARARLPLLLQKDLDRAREELDTLVNEAATLIVLSGVSMEDAG